MNAVEGTPDEIVRALRPGDDYSGSEKKTRQRD